MQTVLITECLITIVVNRRMLDKHLHYKSKIRALPARLVRLKMNNTLYRLFLDPGNVLKEIKNCSFRILLFRTLFF